MSSGKYLELIGVSENNLKDLSLRIEHDQFVAISGISGSGKSSLAFDTIYAEGGRRYIETFSPYTRQFLDRLHKPEIDVVNGVRPALALKQRNSVINSRSTVGTVTEINDYLKIIWSQLSSIKCSSCDKAVTNDTPQQIIENLNKLNKTESDVFAVCFPLSLKGKAKLDSLQETLISEGFLRFAGDVGSQIKKIEELSENEPSSETLNIVVQRFKTKELASALESGSAQRRSLLSALSQSYRFGQGKLSVAFAKGSKVNSLHLFSEDFSCLKCGIDFKKPKPSLFTFNSPIGACKECNGFGNVLRIDPEKCVPDRNLCIEDGAIACWSGEARNYELKDLIKYCKREKISTTDPWKKLSRKHQEAIFNATRKEDDFRGIYEWFKKLERKKYKMHVRVFLSRYRSEQTCPECNGTRLTKNALFYRVGDKTLPDVWNTPISDLLSFFETLLEENRGSEQVEQALLEVLSRINYLNHIGLGYITLNRQSRTLSGGESQRVNLTSILGSRLTNTSIVLDEPSIGLHPRDTYRLLDSIKELRDRGNTVFVVEHDKEVIEQADQVIDIGPLAGSKGGELVHQGTAPSLLKNTKSKTAKHLLEELSPEQTSTTKSTSKSIKIEKACANNLKKIDVEIPLERLCVLAGVSGSGKSTLITECLIKSYEELKKGYSLKQILGRKDAPCSNLKGLNNIDDIIAIDQSPVGRTPRSNAATYTKAWDIIREKFAETEDAKALGLNKSSFSFNVDGGRCPDCKGAGKHKIEMQFLADVYVTCETCGGTRFNETVRSVKLFGKNITEFLDLNISEVEELLKENSDDKLSSETLKRLKPLIDLGLGYLTLGQSLSELSGGEAQRVKLASYLSKKSKEKILFILDEPTTGLHPHDISNLMLTLRTLIAHGHSVLCIEHNTDVIRQSDHLIELGPDGGEKGGKIILSGETSKLLNSRAKTKNSPTFKALNEGFKASKSKKTKKKTRQEKGSNIKVLGARHHNLKNISVDIPKNELTVITGVSGSGKSSLAFDILFSEGQRRYIDCLSPYARQFINQLERPEVDLVDSIPPTVAVSQKTAPPLGVSTIATTTEIYQYLRLLYAKAGTMHCPDHDLPITSATKQDIAKELIEKYNGKRLHLFAPSVSGRKGYYTELFQRALAADIFEARIDGKIVSLEENLRLERHKLHWISLLVASIKADKKNLSLIEEAISQCLVLGNSTLEVSVDDKKSEAIEFSTARVCPKCKRGFSELDPQDFSFRSKRGMCKTCEGYGFIKENAKRVTCPDCKGARITKKARYVYLDGYKIHELTAKTAPELRQIIENLKYDKRLEPVVAPILLELTNRLEIIESIGLDYISLDRESSTISGGEAQRLRLAKTLGSPLSGVCYVLDEPTIGLHPKDHTQLLNTLRNLRDAGNTVVVVEHDEETICSADNIIDLGPSGGSQGGVIVASGSLEKIKAEKNSPTGQALVNRNNSQLKITSTIKKDTKYLELKGASANNLKNIDVKIPLEKLTVVAGVSGAGKSSLVHETLVPAIFDAFSDPDEVEHEVTWSELKGHDSLDRFIEIDQSPVGRTPSSTPASFLKIFDSIRKLYASLPEAQARGWSANYFSFNSAKGGRCKNCEGRGFIKIPMSFLPDAVSTCESCNGMRYEDETLEVTFQGYSIGELLKLTMDEARELFTNHPKIKRPLDYVHELGLGYISLGQATYTLSGGEAQRLKIARELGLREAVNTLYVLDEPTTGLHMNDVDKLMGVLKRLCEKGNTVVLIEHDLSVMRASDYLIEIGPGPAQKGGTLVYQGSLEKFINKKIKNSNTQEFLTNSPQQTKTAEEYAA